MRHAGIRGVALVAVLAAALLLSTIAVGQVRVQRSAEVEASVSSPELNVTGVSYSFLPNLFNNLSVNTTYAVAFTDADTGGAAHTFTILGREGIVYPLSADITSIAYNATYPPLVNINATNTPSADGTYHKNFTSPKNPGWYEFVCTESGHFSLGMYGFISFGMNLPANLSVTTGPTGPGTAVFIIVGTIVTLTVIAIVLGFVIGRRHGAEQEMPPERLGYPEPPGPGGSSPPLSPGAGPPQP
jgi:plastocyanin